METSVAIVGAGRLGTAMGILLRRAGYPIAGVVCRSMERARRAAAQIGAGEPGDDAAAGARSAAVVLFCVPDDAIDSAARRVAAGRRFDEGHILCHTSGSRPASVLRVDGAERAACLSLHPIQTVAEPVSGAERLTGAYFGVEGDADAVSWGEAAVRSIGGRPLAIREGAKALYHAAACMASNYFVTLIDASLSLYDAAGIPASEALSALTPLLEGVLANAGRLGAPAALTGPIERGDVSTVRRHLEALPPDAEIQHLYRTLGLRTLRVAEKKHGGPSPAHEAIRDLLQGR